MTLGVRVIVENERHEILLVRHTYVSGWYLPGGGVETGETMQQAAIKELNEEANIKITGELELLGIYKNAKASKRDHVALFKCTQWEQLAEFEPNLEIAETGFFALEELPDSLTEATQRRLDEVYGDTAQSQYW